MTKMIRILIISFLLSGFSLLRAESYCSAVIDREYLSKISAFIYQSFKEAAAEEGAPYSVNPPKPKNPFAAKSDFSNWHYTYTKVPLHVTLCYGGALKKFGACPLSTETQNTHLYNETLKVNEKHYKVTDVKIMGENKKFIALILSPSVLKQQTQNVSAKLHVSIVSLPHDIDSDEIRYKRAQVVAEKLRQWFVKSPGIKLFYAKCTPNRAFGAPLQNIPTHTP